MIIHDQTWEEPGPGEEHGDARDDQEGEAALGLLVHLESDPGVGEPEGADTEPGHQTDHQHHAHQAGEEGEGDGESGELHRGAGAIAALGAGGEPEQEEREEGGDQADGHQPHREQRVPGTRVQKHQAQAEASDAVTQQQQPRGDTELGGAEFIQRRLDILTGGTLGLPGIQHWYALLFVVCKSFSSYQESRESYLSDRMSSVPLTSYRYLSTLDIPRSFVSTIAILVI